MGSVKVYKYKGIKMSMVKILIKLSAVASIIAVAGTGNAALSCKNVIYGDPNYLDDYRERLAIEARLRDGYFNRYHESLVSDLCNNENYEDVEWLIETGNVLKSEIQSIKEVLGLDKQYLRGLRYQSIKSKFSDMGIASAGASNATESYIHEPDSKCGKLAKSALQGNIQSIKTLRSGDGACYPTDYN